MRVSDTSERGLETLICKSFVVDAGYHMGEDKDFDNGHAVDQDKLFKFLCSSQPEIVEKCNITQNDLDKQKFLHRLQGQITKRGIIDVLRKGIKFGPHKIDLFFGTPTPGNMKAKKLFDANIFSVTRQLHYSKNRTKLSLDLVIFLNGLPFATFELKNSLTKQTVKDAIQQYIRNRDPRELIFQFGRCAVHFAVDDHEIYMCTKLDGKASWFLPFNKGWNDGAGNPPNPSGLKTDYLWKEILTKPSLTNIIENYSQIIEETDNKGRKKRKQIFPRYHQLEVVRKILNDIPLSEVGKRYLIQHSAGSGKSFSIAWLSHQMIELKRNDKPIFDSIIVVTDRRLLDRQIRDTIKQYSQVSAVVGVALHSKDLRRFIQTGKKIITSTIQKFPEIIDEIGDEHRDRTFAIIIDEAHSSQGGKISAKMNIVLSEHGSLDKDLTYEDMINRIIEAKKMLPNASYFAFTATPKNKTLEIFGQPYSVGSDTKYRPFHSYTMKQAIQEGFILDVLKHYTPVESYYRLIKTISDDPEYDVKKAMKKLQRYVESHRYAIKQKSEIMIDHFHDKVIGSRKIGGKARAMIVTNRIRRAIQYYTAFKEYLLEIKSPYKAIVSFSGEHQYGRKKVSESVLNGFSSSQITDKIKQEPYRFLIVADKFQTGYDEPLLHTMYVDKKLSGIKAVQTMSRLNRAHPQKHDTFVLDFYNDVDTIKDAFSDYYRTTILSEETDPNKLHDLKIDLDRHQVYAWEHVEDFVKLYIAGAERDRLDPILDVCVSVYITDLNENSQVDFKSKAKTFVRTYNFLSSILHYNINEWELLSTFLNFLIPKLPAPKEDDLSRGILEKIDMDSYRVEVKQSLEIILPDQDSEVPPVPVSVREASSELEVDFLSNILRTFNDLFGDIEWIDTERIKGIISKDIPEKVSADKAYENAKKFSDKQNARIEHDKALTRVMNDLLVDQTELYKQFSDNESFRKWLTDTIFTLTYYSDVINQQ